MKKNLKAYMAGSRNLGFSDGAILVFAYSVKEAKKLAWKPENDARMICDDDYTDLQVKLQKEAFIREQVPEWSLENQKQGISHVVNHPNSCVKCGIWGIRLDFTGYCEDCEVKDE
jgi:hypothetical protein